MGQVLPLFVNDIEHHLSKAELLYKDGEYHKAIRSCIMALKLCEDEKNNKITKPGLEGKTVALKIFLAKCYSQIGEIEKSNKVYRDLIDEDVYLPPVIMGLMHNNMVDGKSSKVQKNMQLVKIFI